MQFLKIQCNYGKALPKEPEQYVAALSALLLGKHFLDPSTVWFSRSLHILLLVNVQTICCNSPKQYMQYFRGPLESFALKSVQLFKACFNNPTILTTPYTSNYPGRAGDKSQLYKAARRLTFEFQYCRLLLNVVQSAKPVPSGNFWTSVSRRPQNWRLHGVLSKAMFWRIFGLSLASFSDKMTK